MEQFEGRIGSTSEARVPSRPTLLVILVMMQYKSMSSGWLQTGKRSAARGGPIFSRMPQLSRHGDLSFSKFPGLLQPAILQLRSSRRPVECPIPRSARPIQFWGRLYRRARPTGRGDEAGSPSRRARVGGRTGIDSQQGAYYGRGYHSGIWSHAIARAEALPAAVAKVQPGQHVALKVWHAAQSTLDLQF